MIAGLIFNIIDVSFYLKNLTDNFSGIFVLVLLPPIIFESGYNMNKKSFFKNGGTVLMFSFLGTFIAIFSSSFLFWLAGQTRLSPEFTWQEAFAFGSLISATDPVSVLACFKEMDADNDLYAVIFGESIFNDAVALVMYEIVMKVGGQNKSFGEYVSDGIEEFLLVFTGSLFLGAIFALLIAFVLKR
jgi:NhaP-type Na+/H+ or K+/H+ antiporter